MFRKIAIVALMFASVATARAGTGLAGDITIETEPFQSTRTRAEVRHEVMGNRDFLAQYREDSGSSTLRFASTRSRQEVVAEYVANRDEVAAMTREDSGSALLYAAGSRNPRYLAAR